MSCCDGWHYANTEVNGECHDCGMATVDGQAQEGCHWSPIDCESCGSAPCDLSC